MCLEASSFVYDLSRTCYNKPISSTQRKINKLQPLQNRVIRIVEKRTGYINTADMTVLHSKCNLKLLHNRRKMFM